jgi:hypothetical protein
MPLIRRGHFWFSILAGLLFVTFLHSRPSFLLKLPGRNTYHTVKKYDEPAPFDTSAALESTILGVTSIPGFTLFDRLYLRNGTFYVVSSDGFNLPPKRNILAPPVNVGQGYDMEPTDQVSNLALCFSMASNNFRMSSFAGIAIY